MAEKCKIIINNESVARVSDEFLSVAIDASQVIGKDWWNPQPKKNFGIFGKYNPKPFDFDRKN